MAQRSCQLCWVQKVGTACPDHLWPVGNQNEDTLSRVPFRCIDCFQYRRGNFGIYTEAADTERRKGLLTTKEYDKGRHFHYWQFSQPAP
jgi:hypothetical protein